MRHLQDIVCRAADEFRAADDAATPEAAQAHLGLASELVHLIKCDGNMVSYRIGRRKRVTSAPEVVMPDQGSILL
jgi:hypothetical protein